MFETDYRFSFTTETFDKILNKFDEYLINNDDYTQKLKRTQILKYLKKSFEEIITFDEFKNDTIVMENIGEI